MNQPDLQSLSSRPENPNNSVLSVYLSVDQSEPSNRNRGFERQLKTMMAELRRSIIDPWELQRFRKAATRIEDFVKSYQIGSRGLVMFLDESDTLFWHKELQVPTKNQVRWNREPLLQPLAATIDEAESYAIALIGQASFRLFVVSLDRIEELVEETFPPREVRHIRSVGPIASGSHVQRKADERVRENPRHIADDISWLMESKEFNRLVLAGTPQITAELYRLLPKRVASRMIGSVDLSTDAPVERVLAETQPIVQKYEHEAERRLVDRILTEASKTSQAITGLGHTLKAINQARVWQLICSGEFHCSGFECPNCAALFSRERKLCLYCGAFIHPVTDVVERAVEHALRKGAKVEVVKGEASASLGRVGGIGAFLKTRTGSLQV